MRLRSVSCMVEQFDKGDTLTACLLTGRILLNDPKYWGVGGGGGGGGSALGARATPTLLRLCNFACLTIKVIHCSSAGRQRD